MKRIYGIVIATLGIQSALDAQLGPPVTSWLQNTTTTGTYYVNANPNPLSNGILVNCQTVQYSANFVYVNTKGIPAYPTGPFLDGNPSQASNQNAIFKFPRNPVQNTGNPYPTTMGNIGVLINGVAIFDYSDGVSWKLATNAFAGGPLGGNGDGVWNRDAVVYEKLGFDCSKGHPAMGNYHHHQNPSAFKNDLSVISTICNPYDADALYVIDSLQHSPLIGFAYDGFPIYGAYGYKNANGTGGVVRIRSGYQLRNITVRTHYADGSDVTDGPPVSSTYPLGTFREDYEWVSHPGQEEYLDVHNGRFCVTPEYPNGTYAYFATVNATHNSYYPYFVGPTFYGIWANRKVTSITETVTPYVSPTAISETEFESLKISIAPNPASELLLVQIGDLLKYDMNVELYDLSGKCVLKSRINKGSTLGYMDVQTLYDGTYLLKIYNGEFQTTRKVVIQH